MLKYHQPYSEILKIPNKILMKLLKLTKPGDPDSDVITYLENWTEESWVLPEEPPWRQ